MATKLRSSEMETETIDQTHKLQPINQNLIFSKSKFTQQKANYNEFLNDKWPY